MWSLYIFWPVPMDPPPLMGHRVHRYGSLWIIKPIWAVFSVVFHDSWTDLTRDFCVGEHTCATRVQYTAEMSRRPNCLGFFPCLGPFWASFSSASWLQPRTVQYIEDAFTSTMSSCLKLTTYTFERGRCSSTRCRTREKHVYACTLMPGV